MVGVRSMVVWCDDWPVAAMGAAPTDPAVVVHANRVVAATPAARRVGVQVGHRRREAQSRCPELEVFERDLAREARAFEPILRAVETFTPRIELTRPGACTFATRGPSRYFGGDQALADQVVALVDAALAGIGWRGAARVGVADGPFAATLAARFARDPEVKVPSSPSPTRSSPSPAGPVGRRDQIDDATSACLIVPPETSPAFVAPFSVRVLGQPDLADVLARLGLTTLGALATLDAIDVLARFGTPGQLAHRLARGLDERPPDAREPPPDLVVAAAFAEPAERIDQAAFLAKALADELFTALDARGLSCTRVLIGAETAHGETIERLWRHEGALSAGAVTDRVRWQLEGWLQPTTTRGITTERGTAGATERPTSGIARLWIAPDEVVPAHGRQLGFWGGETEADTRAVRALARVQGLLSPDEVRVPEWRGGRGPGEQLHLVPAATVDLTATRAAARPEWVTAPWPGRLPTPSPAVLHGEPLTAEVLDAEQRRVTVDGRARISAAPAWVVLGRRPPVAVGAWAGPWPVEERWWDPATQRRRARFQMVLADDTAHLLVLEQGTWWLEATYD